MQFVAMAVSGGQVLIRLIAVSEETAIKSCKKSMMSFGLPDRLGVSCRN